MSWDRTLERKYVQLTKTKLYIVLFVDNVTDSYDYSGCGQEAILAQVK